MSEAQAEKVFYDQGGVRVTSARFQVGAQTYAMASVNSVTYQKREAETGTGWALAILGGVFLLIVALVLVASGFSMAVAVFGGGSLVMLVGGVSIVRSALPTFLVVLTTANGQSTALSNQDSTVVEPVVRALNEALVSRG